MPDASYRKTADHRCITKNCAVHEMLVRARHTRGSFDEDRRGLTASADDDGDDQPVDTEHTSHDDGHDRLHDQLRTQDTHGSNADTGLGCAIGGTEACINTPG